jgi:hypothetical protein
MMRADRSPFVMVSVREALASLRYAGFRRFLLARAISVLGNAGTRVALVWYVLEQQRNPAWLSLVLIANAAPQFVVGLVAGVLADQASRKAILIWTNVVSGATLLTAWLLATAGRLHLPLLIGLVAVLAVCAALLNPSAVALIPQITSRDAIASANSLRTTVDQLAQIVGPAAAGFVVAAWDAHAWFLLDAGSFVLAAVLIAAIRTTAGEPAPGRRTDIRHMTRDVADAGRYIARTRWLRIGLFAGAVANLALVAPLSVVVPVLISERQLSATTLGWYGTMLAAGTVVGALVGGSLTAAAPLHRALAALIASGLVTTVIGFAPTVAVILAVGFILGVTLAVFEVMWDTYELTRLPDRLLAKVLSWDLWLSFSMRTLGLGVIGALGTTMPAVTTVVCGALLVVVVAGLLLNLGRGPDQPARPAAGEPDGR